MQEVRRDDHHRVHIAVGDQLAVIGITGGLGGEIPIDAIDLLRIQIA